MDDFYFLKVEALTLIDFMDICSDMWIVTNNEKYIIEWDNLTYELRFVIDNKATIAASQEVALIWLQSV